MGHNLESWSVFQFIGREFWVLQKGQRASNTLSKLKIHEV